MTVNVGLNVLTMAGNQAHVHQLWNKHDGQNGREDRRRKTAKCTKPIGGDEEHKEENRLGEHDGKASQQGMDTMPPNESALGRRQRRTLWETGDEEVCDHGVEWPNI